LRSKKIDTCSISSRRTLMHQEKTDQIEMVA